MERDRGWARETERLVKRGGREGKRQCRELALNPIALCGPTTGFY